MATVLIIEDRPIDRSLLATILRSQGHDIVEATDGQEGLALLRRASPDLVVSDILMPTMDGYEFVYPKAQARSIARAETVEIPVAPRG